MQQFRINVDFEGIGRDSHSKIVKKAALATLNQLKIQNPASLNILLAGDEKLRELNHQFLGNDYATDVLSFPIDEVVPGMEDHLGDIAISLDCCRRQALDAGHSVKAELQLLVVHGVLHLLGYDHQFQKDLREMWSVQAAVLGGLNSDIRYPTPENYD
jgi:probable rRNA maturation factor